MKFTQPYNYRGIFRYLKYGKWLKQTLPKPVNSLIQSFVQNRLETAKWRKLGLWTDDLIVEENDVVKEALARIPKEHYYARYQRAKVALHQNMLRRDLPKDQWVTSEQDQKYLLPFVEQVISEYEEREKYDNGVFERA